MLPRYVVPVVLIAVAVFVLIMYLYPNTGSSIYDEPDFTDNASTTSISVNSSSQTLDIEKIIDKQDDLKEPKQYVINVSDAPNISD